MDKIDLAKKRAEEILAQYGVSHWNIKITNARKTLAVTDHLRKRVELSKYFILKSTLEDFDGVMHHEIAHILAGPGKGHSREFVSICQELNLDESFSCDNFPIHIKYFLYTCPNCGLLGSDNRKKKLVCNNCLDRGELVDLEVVRNVIRPVQWASTP